MASSRVNRSWHSPSNRAGWPGIPLIAIQALALGVLAIARQSRVSGALVDEEGLEILVRMNWTNSATSRNRGELLREVGVTDRLGCGRSAIALYGATLPRDVVTRTGTDLEHLLLWQYVGTDPQDPARSLAGYPLVAPGCGRVDISVLTLPGGIDKMRSMLQAEAPVPATTVG